MTHDHRGSGQPHRVQVPGALEVREVADEQLAAPDCVVGAEAGAVEDCAHRRAALAVLGERRREVGVVVLDRHELDALALNMLTMIGLALSSSQQSHAEISRVRRHLFGSVSHTGLSTTVTTEIPREVIVAHASR